MQPLFLQLGSGPGHALYDAIGRTVISTRMLLAEMPEAQRPESVHLIIGTAGADNSSTEYTAGIVKSLLKAQEEIDKWFICYPGTNTGSHDIDMAMDCRGTPIASPQTTLK